jgi:hypothetical protein
MENRLDWLAPLAAATIASGCGVCAIDCATLSRPAIAAPAVKSAAGAPTAAAIPCGRVACPGNAASVGDGLYFHELDASGKSFNNDGKGLRVVSFHHPALGPLQLEVHGHDLVGNPKVGPSLTRGQLQNAVLTLEREDGQKYEVRIAAVGSIEFWVAPTIDKAKDGETTIDPTIPTYTFIYQKLGTGLEAPLCSVVDENLAAEWMHRTNHTPGTTATLALVFAGDHYDAAAKTVGPPDPNGKWFNVACAGSAMAKMHVLRHTEAGSHPMQFGGAGPWTTTFDQRQAMFKMITDDICGTGYSFTVDGENVYYADERSWHPLGFDNPTVPLPVKSIEALWGKDGAICLNEPRRAEEDSCTSARIACICKKVLPRCDDLFGGMPTIGSDWDHWKIRAAVPAAYGISANPVKSTP